MTELTQRQFTVELLKRSFKGIWGWAHLLLFLFETAGGVTLVVWPELDVKFKLLLAVPLLIILIALVLSPYWVSYRLYREALTHTAESDIDLPARLQALVLERDRKAAELSAASQQRDKVAAELETTTNQRDELRRQFDKILAQIRQAFHRKDMGHGAQAILEEDHTIRFEVDGSATCTKSSRFRALTRVSAIPQEILGEPAQSLASVGAELQGDRSHRTILLPGEDGPNKKIYYVLFWPELSPEEEVTYKMGWKWPEAWRKLMEGSPDSITHDVKSAQPIRRLRFHLKFANDFPPIKKITSIRDGDAREIEPVDGIDPGYRTRSFEVAEAKPGISVEFLIERA